jgi:hypothetical protein
MLSQTAIKLLAQHTNLESLTRMPTKVFHWNPLSGEFIIFCSISCINNTARDGFVTTYFTF